MSRAHLYILAFVLFVTGSSIAVYRHTVGGVPFSPKQPTNVWTIEARVEIKPDPALPIKVRLPVPNSPPYFRILEEQTISGSYGYNYEIEGDNRYLVWTERRSEDHDIIYYRTTVVADPRAEPQSTPPPAVPPIPDYAPDKQSTILNFLDEIRADSADISSFTAVLMERLAQTERGRLISSIVESDSLSDPADIAVHLLKGARIPARTASVFRLGSGTEHKMERLVQVHDEKWLLFDPHNGNRLDPADYFLWTAGNKRLISADNTLSTEVSFSVIKEIADKQHILNQYESNHPEFIEWFSFTNLNLDTQSVFKVLILLPIGALLIVFMRIVIGIPTVGTFTPVLLALAFQNTVFFLSLIVSAAIIGFGMTVRLYLEHLNLLFVPKITVVLSSVILMVAVVSLSASQSFFASALSVSLFPIVVLAWIIERLSVVWDEDGPADALKQALGTLVAAALSYLLFQVDALGYVFFYFPELILVIMALSLILGRYNGYRLTELYRFRAVDD